MSLRQSGKDRKTALGWAKFVFRQGLGRTLFLWLFVVSIIPLTIVSMVSYQNAHMSLRADAEKSLRAISKMKTEQIRSSFSRMLTDLRHQAEMKTNVKFLEDLISGSRKSGKRLGDFVKSLKWTAIVDEHGAHLTNYRRTYGYHDIFLMDAKGNILFSVTTENDLGTNLLSGQHSDTRFAAACNKALETGRVTFSDFEPYAPSDNQVAGFLVSVMVGEDGEKIGLMAFQIQMEQIDPVMQESAGLGRTEETYLIGTDLKMRSNSVFSEEETILKKQIDTEQARLWQKGRSQGHGESDETEEPAFIYDGPHGKRVLGMHRDIHIAGVHYAVVAEIEEAEAFAATNRLRNIVVSLLIVTIAVVLLAATAVATRIVRPILQLSTWAQQVATGSLTYEEIRTPENEIGQMNRSFRGVVDSFRQITAVCESIASGDFSKSVEIRSKDDVLGKAIERMGRHLKESNEDAQRKISYLNNIPTVVHVIDRDFNIQFVNQECTRLAGKTADECIGEKCYRLFNTSHCNTEKCRAAKAMKLDKTMTGDATAGFAEFDTFPMRYTCAPLKDETGNMVGSIVYMVDITDEQTTVDIAEKISQGDYSIEVARRSEEDRLADAINKMTRTLRDVSEENEEQNWFKAGQMELNDRVRGDQDLSSIGRNIITFLAEYLNAQIGAVYFAGDNNHLTLMGSYAFKKRKNLSNEFEFGEGLVGQAAMEKQSIVLTSVPDDYIAVGSGLGEAVPRNIVVLPFLHNGEVKGVIELGSLNEFSDRDLNFLNQAAESIAVGVHSARSRQQVVELLGRSQTQAKELQVKQEELTQSNKELEEQAQALRASEEHLQTQQEELEQANRQLQKNATELEEQTALLEMQKAEIEKKNVELKKAQRIVQEKATDLEKASKYKSEFLANMSHELRTPLNGVLLLSKLLSDNKEGNLTDKELEFAQTIHSAGSDLLRLINDILDLSKVEAGKMELHIEDVALKDIASTTERNFGTVADEKGLSLSTELTHGLPDRIRTDRQRVGQIIQNLLSNAFKFTLKGGRVSLKIGRPGEQISLSKSGLDPSKAIAFSVSDTGKGIPKDKQRLIFEAFQQEDGTTSRKFGGTGLGLSISKELVNLLGGEIQLESEEGKGSTFTFYLPQKLTASMKQRARDNSFDAMPPAPRPTRKEATDEQPDSGSEQEAMAYVADDRKEMTPGDKSILIIEDDAKFAKILCDLSREKGFKVLIAEDGETGLHFADYYMPSAIILDIGLPGIDGWGVMSRLKDNPQTRHVPVHFISACDDGLDAMKMGAIGYLAKPVSMEGLDAVYSRIERMISKPVKELLVVEDNVSQQEFIAKIIGNGDVRITTASNAVEAHDLLLSGKFDCMILDVGLPDMSGVDLLNRIRSEDPLLHMPVIIYTGRELTEEENETLHEYAQSIIIKGARSPERLLDETTLFLHRVEANLPEETRQMLRMVHDKESVLNNKKILLADDDMRNVFAVTHILEEKGMEVLVGKNGKEALEHMTNNSDIDLVLMDIMMPEMDGYEAMREIRKDENFKDLPIIALTAKAMRGDRAKCIEAGANDYIAKPVDPDKLLSMLRVWLY